MSRPTLDGTTEPVSRDRILRRKQDREKNSFPVEQTISGIDDLSRLIHTLMKVMIKHT